LREVRSISIKSVRIAKGLTQLELAKMVGVDQTAIHQWEAEKTHPRFSRLQNIAKALECEVKDLIEGDAGT